VPDRLIYLCGIAGNVETSPAMAQLAAAGWDVVVPQVPGFDGESGFVAPDTYLDWLTTFWDAIDATGALPCPVVGASVGIVDATEPGFDLYAVPAAERMPHLFAKGVPEVFDHRFAHKGDEEAPVARYLSDIAAASLLWPLGDRGLAKRLHRMPADRLVLWGDQDEINPVSRAALWGGAHVVPGAGHLLEWDSPDEVAAAVLAHLG
jgi:pimeloyl-ACP methyl ester carboxylesterase